MLLLASIAVFGDLFVAGTALAGLRRAFSAFEPDAIIVLWQIGLSAEAPSLWRMVNGLAECLGASKPDAIVVASTKASSSAPAERS